MTENTTDIRTFDVELTRDSTDNSRKIGGYAALWNVPSVKMPFIEYIDEHALDDVDLSRVLLLYAHDFNNILARVDAGTLSLKVDKTGLAFTASLPDTTLAHDTFENIKAGNVKGVSVGFRIADGGDRWDVIDGQTVHYVDKFDALNEISLTPIPAYSQTSVEVQRSLDKLKAGDDMADKQKEDELKSEEAKDEKPEATEGTKELAGRIDHDPQVDDSKDEEKRDDAEPNKEVEDLKAELDLLRSQMEALTKKNDQPNEKQDEKEPAEEADDKGDDKDMSIDLTKTKLEDEESRDFAEFLRTGEIKRDAAGFDSAAGEAVLPTEILNVLKQPNDPSQLSTYVNKVQVSAPTGKLPVLKKATARLASAEELAENPQIANAAIDKVNYDVETLRGQLPISMEMTQDYPSIKGLLAEYVGEVKNQTEQYKIGAVLATATPVAAASVDDIKDAYNKGLTNYGKDRMFVVSESFYAEIDKVKDADGRYLLQDSIASETGKSLLGATVVVVPDEVLGEAGAMVAFVGSLKAFVLEAIRANIQLQWVRNEQFEQVLGVALRADFKPADTDAGKFITYTPAPKA